MTPDEAIAIVDSKASGRTRYDGQEPFMDEVLVKEIRRLRAVVDKLPKTADGVPVGIGDTVYFDLDTDEHIRRFSDYGRRFSDYGPIVQVEIVPLMFNEVYGCVGWNVQDCYSTPEAATAAREQSGGAEGGE